MRHIVRSKEGYRDGDLYAVFFVWALAFGLWILMPQFITATQNHPFLMGFMKVGVLATFGSLLKIRRRIGVWEIDLQRLPFSFAIWGMFGIWFTLAFPLFGAGMGFLIETGLWPSVFTYGAFWGSVWLAFSKSLAINLIGGFAFTMMLTHEYLEKQVESRLHRKRWLTAKEFGDGLDKGVWFWAIPMSIVVFWVLAHTFTFSLAPHFQVLSAAVLSVALGFLTTTRAKSAPLMVVPHIEVKLTCSHPEIDHCVGDAAGPAITVKTFEEILNRLMASNIIPHSTFEVTWEIDLSQVTETTQVLKIKVQGLQVADLNRFVIHDALELIRKLGGYAPSTVIEVVKG